MLLHFTNQIIFYILVHSQKKTAHISKTNPSGTQDRKHYARTQNKYILMLPTKNSHITRGERVWHWARAVNFCSIFTSF